MNSDEVNKARSDDPDAPLDKKFYEDEFDGVSTDGFREGAETLKDSTTGGTDFGFPLNPVEIQSGNSDEFEADTGKVLRRGITKLDLSRPESLSSTSNPASADFDASHGASFHAMDPSIFASPEGSILAAPKPAPLTAPLLPFYLKPERTSFRSTAACKALCTSIEASFAALSVAWQGIEGCRCAYSCSAMSLLSVVEFEVRVFLCPAAAVARPPQEPCQEHLVQVMRLSGCRYAFADTAAALLGHVLSGCEEAASSSPHASSLPKAVPSPESPKSVLACKPPPLSDAALLGMPTLRRATSSPPDVPAVVTPAAAKAGPEATLPPLPLDEEEKEAACTCDHVLALLGDDQPDHVKVQGARAAGALAASLADAMGSCAHLGACGADHRDHALLFAEGGAWVSLAERIAVLAAAREDTACQPSGGELRAVAMGAVANVAALQHVCGKWLNKAVEGVAGVLLASESPPHVKREALRAALAMAKRDKALVAKLVRAGVVPALELEAEGCFAEDELGRNARDDAAIRLAQGVLAECRS